MNGPGRGCANSQPKPIRTVPIPVLAIVAPSVASKSLGPGCTPKRCSRCTLPADLVDPVDPEAATEDPPPHARTDTATATKRVPAASVTTRGNGPSLSLPASTCKDRSDGAAP